MVSSCINVPSRMWRLLIWALNRKAMRRSTMIVLVTLNRVARMSNRMDLHRRNVHKLQLHVSNLSIVLLLRRAVHLRRLRASQLAQAGTAVRLAINGKADMLIDANMITRNQQ